MSWAETVRRRQRRCAECRVFLSDDAERESAYCRECRPIAEAEAANIELDRRKVDLD